MTQVWWCKHHTFPEPEEGGGEKSRFGGNIFTSGCTEFQVLVRYPSEDIMEAGVDTDN